MDIFLKKIDRSLSDCIIIVDEGHNLGNRVRDLMTAKLSTLMIKRALKEADKYGYPDHYFIIDKLNGIIEGMSENLKHDEENLILKQEFMKKITDFMMSRML